VTPQDFDRLMERERFVAAVEQGLAKSEAGLGTSNEELSDHFERRFREAQDK
jgi:predicted transcriptional regulator